MIYSLINNSLNEARVATETFCASVETIRSIELAAKIIADCLYKEGKILSCGNGGSCCDAMHFAEELTGRFRENRKSLPAIAISDPAYITCVGNDYNFDEIFSRYVSSVGCKGDVLLAISTSGQSGNVLLAAKEAKLKGMKIVVLTGSNETALTGLADVVIHTPESAYSDRIQELHITAIHIIIEAVEKLLKL